MSMNLRKRWDRTSNPDASDSQSQIITGSEVKKKKRKVTKLDIMYMSSSNMEETLKRKNSKTQDTKSAHHISKSRNTGELSGQETSMKKKRKKEHHQGAEDITANDTSTSVVLYQDNKEKVKKSHKPKATKRLHRGEHFTEETPCIEFTDLDGRSEKEKDHVERLLGNSSVEESLNTDSQHSNKRNKKQKGWGDLHGETFNDKHFFQRKSPTCSETPKQVDKSLDQSETAIKKKKKKIKHRPHQEEGGITADYVASNAVLYQKEKIQITHKAKDPKRLSRDEGLPEESIYRELADVNDRISLKKKKCKKDCVLEDSLLEESLTTEALHIGKKKTKWNEGGQKSQRQHGFTEELANKREHHGGSETTQQVGEGVDQTADTLVEELLISHCQPTKKIKKWKGGGGLQDHGFTEELLSHRKTPDGSDAPEQVSGCLGQVEKPKKKKKRKIEFRQAVDIAVDDASSSVCLRGDKPSYRELNNTEDRPSPKKKKSKKDHLECPIEDSLVEELLNYNDQRTSKKKKAKLKGRDKTETTEQVVETVDQAKVHVKKKKAKLKGRDKTETTEQVVETVDQAEVHVKKKKKKKAKLKGRDKTETTEQVVETVDQSEVHVKKKAKLKGRDKTEATEQVVETVDQAEVHVKKKKKKKKKAKLKGRDKTETTEQVVETVDQAEVHVKKKKAKTKKHLSRKEEKSGILAEEMQTEVDQSLQSRVVESDGNVKDTEHISTSGLNRPKTCASTDTDKNPATQGESEEVQNEGDNRLVTSGKNTEKGVVKRKYKRPSIQEEDLALLEEYIPNLKSLSSKRLHRLFSQDLERIRIAKQKGIVFHYGQFTIEEDEQIKKNVEKFMSEFGIHSAEMLFHPYKFPEQKKTIRKLKIKFKFIHRIAEGLHRTTLQVFKRGTLLYENSSVKGRFSKDEVRQLKKYHELHGDNWKTIGSLLNRSYVSCQLKSTELRNDVNRGVWSIEETNRLIAAVKEFVLDGLQREKSNNEEIVTAPKIKLYTGIKWVQIAQKVETRSFTLCRDKWFELVMLRMNYGIHPYKGTLKIQNTIKIIKWMHESKVKDPRDIKWDKLCDDIGNIPKLIVQKNVLNIKRTIKGWKNMRLYEIVDCLYHKKLPELEAKLFAAEEILIEPEKKNEFLISEIFQEWSEIDEIWGKAGSKAKVRAEGGRGHPGDPAWSVPSGSQCTDAYI